MADVDHDPSELLGARLAVQDALIRVFVCTDRRDWKGLRSVLGERVALDYTSLNGGEPAQLSGDEVVAAWKAGLGGYEATQHLVGSLLIDEIGPTEARLRFYAQATHVLHDGHGDGTWTVAGHYDAIMRRRNGWRLESMTLHVDWCAGNQQLAVIAAAAAGA